MKVRRVHEIPLFLDSWFWGNAPQNEDLPPRYDGERRPFPDNNDSMQRFAINRHHGAINGIYLDQSLRRIPLKQLWRQRWHRHWDMTYPLPDWPEWMQQFPDP